MIQHLCYGLNKIESGIVRDVLINRAEEISHYILKTEAFLEINNSMPSRNFFQYVSFTGCFPFISNELLDVEKKYFFIKNQKKELDKQLSTYRAWYELDMLYDQNNEIFFCGLDYLINDVYKFYEKFCNVKKVDVQKIRRIILIVECLNALRLLVEIHPELKKRINELQNPNNSFENDESNQKGNNSAYPHTIASLQPQKSICLKIKDYIKYRTKEEELHKIKLAELDILLFLIVNHKPIPRQHILIPTVKRPSLRRLILNIKRKNE